MIRINNSITQSEKYCSHRSSNRNEYVHEKSNVHLAMEQKSHSNQQAEFGCLI